MKPWLSVTLFILFLIPGVAVAGNPGKKQQGEKQLLSTLQELVIANVALGKGLLQAERDRNLGSLLHKIRINLNAKAMLRVHKAYLFFLGSLEKKVPTLTAASKQSLRAWIAEFKTAAERTRSDSDAGKWKTYAPTSSPKATSLATVKPLSESQVKTLLGVIDAFGPSLEILSYYRLLQVAHRKKRAGLISFLRTIQRAKRSLKALSSVYSKSAPSLRVMHYHMALTMRCGLLQLRMMKSKGGKRASYKMRYDQRKTQLAASLAKANSAFRAFWKSAIDER